MYSDALLREMQKLHREANALGLLDPRAGELRERMYARFQRVSGRRDNVPQELPPKKSLEANRLLLFALHYPDFPDGAISIGEKPDFIVDGAKKIGIEMTDAYVHPARNPLHRQQGSLLKWQECVQDTIVELAQELHARAGGPPLRVVFSFARDTYYSKADIRPVAQQLSKSVPAWLASTHDVATIYPSDSTIAWPKGLDSLAGHARGGAVHDLPRWDAYHGGTVHRSEAFFQERIALKEEKLLHYQHSGCDEIWLVLVVEGFAQSSFMRPPNANHSFASSFDRLVGFWLAERRTINLRLH